MNNAGHSGRDIIMVLNDNGMSIAPNVGAINKYLGSIIASPITVRIRERVKALIESVSHIVGGQKLVDFAKTMEESIKNFWSPGMLFEELGFRYFGPIDGHNVAQLVQTFEIVKTLKGPRVRSEEHTSELQSHHDLVCRLLLEKKKQMQNHLYGSSNIGATAKNISNVVTDAASGVFDIFHGIHKAVVDTWNNFWKDSKAVGIPP